MVVNFFVLEFFVCNSIVVKFFFQSWKTICAKESNCNHKGRLKISKRGLLPLPWLKFRTVGLLWCCSIVSAFQLIEKNSQPPYLRIPCNDEVIEFLEEQLLLFFTTFKFCAHNKRDYGDQWRKDGPAYTKEDRAAYKCGWKRKENKQGDSQKGRKDHNVPTRASFVKKQPAKYVHLTLKSLLAINFIS